MLVGRRTPMLLLPTVSCVSVIEAVCEQQQELVRTSRKRSSLGEAV